VNRDKLNYRVETIQRKFDIAQKEVSGVIYSSLYESGIDNGLSQALLYDLTSIFQWKIDFNSEIRPGDRYALVYEEKSLDGKKVSTGPILAAEFVVGGRTYRAIRHVNRNGVTRYFTPEGESLHGLFLRSPMRITRITSPYSLRRFHPVLKVWRAHKGVDYGGRTGDRVMATADGHVKFAGRKNNYGKVIILQHGKKYSTLYAHLSRFAPNIRKGRNVSQGQVIGYVGQTGLANGPHLHYEFRVHNVHQNPLTVKLPRSFAIDRTERTDFMRKAEFWSTHLSRIAKR
jgi:murein DD-endopeptidase MepM/ murein hydrolase activator NlpD